MDEQIDTGKILKERFRELPKAVQNAITSADIQKHLRELADTHQLHIDQWEILENEVTMTLFGINPIDELQANIQKELGVSEDVARDLTTNISRIVFEPIRTELERELAVTKPQDSEQQIETPAHAAAQPVAAATPPAARQLERSVRAPISGLYAPEQPSHERKAVEGDPYREQLS